MTELLLGFWVIGTIGLIASMSPGPDFAVVLKNSLMYSRKTGIATATGISAGILVHVSYTLIGVGFVISQSIILFSIIKISGALYLLYLGIQLLKTKNDSHSTLNTAQKNITNISFGKAMREGFLTNVLNPKVTIFFVSIFTQIVGPSTPLFIQLSYGIEIAFVALLWFVFLATFSTTPIINHRIRKGRKYIEKTFGVILIALGLKLAIENRW